MLTSALVLAIVAVPSAIELYLIVPKKAGHVE